MPIRTASILAAVLLAITGPLTVGPATAGQEDEAAASADAPPDLGHSAHGAAFDEGPRQRPWPMDGIGSAHFPITTAVPEVQTWFDQGNALLHNFWWFEAERSFRWCVKLDPECAMAWWGLARATSQRGQRTDRMIEFLRRAVEHRATTTEREQMYIDAWAKAYLPEWAENPAATEFRWRAAHERLGRDLEKIVLAYPDDNEAKALYALASLYGSTRYANDAVLREIIESNPEHPAAHHYRIHNWDGKDGAAALDSCEVYGRVAWYSGHANHMPGHIYSGIGLWHEGAIWMDSATRVEKRYMERRMTLPYHNWNYAHNRNYLSFIQEQLGLPTLAIDGARQLIAAPHDPKYNKPNDWGRIRGEGMRALVRALIKFERWDTILDGETIPWGDSKVDTLWRSYAEGLAHLAKGDIRAAVEKRDETAKAEGGHKERMRAELAGRIAIARGLTIEGLQTLATAAAQQADRYRHENDPPSYPHLLYTVLGELNLDLESPGRAALCFEQTLEICPNDPFALSGLARARHALGEYEAAKSAYGKLLFNWSDAEEGLRWMDDARALGIDAEPIDDGPRPQRSYRAQTLDPLGPQTWRPYAAPALDALDAKSDRVTLDDYAGKNVLLVFFLGEECAHCVEQLEALGKKENEFLSRDVELLAISSNTPDEHAASLELGELPFRLLADADHANARRFHAFDDFEELELHATILIDREGRVRWHRTGGDPFMEIEFLLGEIDRVNEGVDVDTNTDTDTDADTDANANADADADADADTDANADADADAGR